jgi:addiction module HigA family antidote
MTKRIKLPPIHPGEILREDFLVPLGLSMNKLASELRVPVTRIAEIIHERRGITTNTAIRLAQYFGNTPHFWLNLQRDYELEMIEDQILHKIKQEIIPLAKNTG